MRLEMKSRAVVLGVLVAALVSCTGDGGGSVRQSAGDWKRVRLEDVTRPDGSVSLDPPADGGLLEIALAGDAAVTDLIVGQPGSRGLYVLDLAGHGLTVRGNLAVQGGVLILRDGGAIEVDGNVTIAGGAGLVQEWVLGDPKPTAIKLAGSWNAEGFLDLGSAVRLEGKNVEGTSEGAGDRVETSGYGLVGMLQLPGLATASGANLMGMEIGVFYEEGEDSFVSLGVPVTYREDGSRISVETEGLFEIWLRTADGGELRPAERKVHGLSGHSWGMIENIVFRFNRPAGGPDVDAVVIRVGETVQAFMARKQR